MEGSFGTYGAEWRYHHSFGQIKQCGLDPVAYEDRNAEHERFITFFRVWADHQRKGFIGEAHKPTGWMDGHATDERGHDFTRAVVGRIFIEMWQSMSECLPGPCSSS